MYFIRPLILLEKGLILRKWNFKIFQNVIGNFFVYHKYIEPFKLVYREQQNSNIVGEQKNFLSKIELSLQ